jgi:hypothetical protein
VLGNLDNEVIFKKAFTDPTVFKAFVRDILGIEVEVDKIETERSLSPKWAMLILSWTFLPRVWTNGFALKYKG